MQGFPLGGKLLSEAKLMRGITYFFVCHFSLSKSNQKISRGYPSKPLRMLRTEIQQKLNIPKSRRTLVVEFYRKRQAHFCSFHERRFT